MKYKLVLTNPNYFYPYEVEYECEESPLDYFFRLHYNETGIAGLDAETAVLIYFYENDWWVLRIVAAMIEGAVYVNDTVDGGKMFLVSERGELVHYTPPQEG